MCKVDGCEQSHSSRGLCSQHYIQLVDVKAARKKSAQKYQQTVKGKEASRRKAKKWRNANPAKHLYWLAKSRADEKGLPFTIAVTDIIIPTVCPVLGIPLKRGEGKVLPNSPSIDRVIPALGYVPENIRVISRRANELKNNMTVEQAEMLLDWMRKETNQVKEQLHGIPI